jgi:Raf kinase inhibitor-like YbhB/YbcL family protein
VRPRTATRRCLLAVGAVLGLLALTGCDTGDGKTLQDFDPADYPDPTPSTQIEGTEGGSSVVIGTGFEGAVDEGFLSTTVAGAPATATPGSIELFTLTAPWVQGGPIDPDQTCDGLDVAPALSWGGVPSGTAEIVIALVDDSAVSNGEPFVHWVIGGLNPDEIAVAEGDLPEGAVQALNFFGDVGYGGPCPPPGDEAHVYRLTAYALNSPSQVADGTRATEFLTAIAPLTLRSTDLSGTYQR